MILISIIRQGKIVETIPVKELKKKVVQKIAVEFLDDCTKQVNLNYPGVEIVENNNNHLLLRVTESLSEVLHSLSNYKIATISIPEPMLEDYFMHFYEET